jgi:uncharacterized protein
MNTFIYIFAAVFILLYLALSYYIGLRGLQGLRSIVPSISKRVYWIVFWIIASAYIASMLLSRVLPEQVMSVLIFVGGYWLAAMFYLLLILPVIDIVRLINNRTRFLSKHIKVNLTKLITILVLVGLSIILSYGTWSARSPKVTKYTVDINKSGGNFDNLRIIMVSDIHLGDIIGNKRLNNMVERINALEPDVVLIVGDMLDSKIEPYIEQQMGETLRKLEANHGVFASLGNHEFISGKVQEVVDEYTEAGITVLRDEAVLIEDSFYIAGRDDTSIERFTGSARKPIGEILESVNQGRPIILLDHQPIELEDAEKSGVDLMISGHTHRGQIAPIFLITNRIFEIDYGHLKRGDFNIIVTSGYGTWGPPVRTGSRSEIVEITINFKN